MEIKVLGTGCANCKKLEQGVREVVQELGIDATVSKIEDPGEILGYGCMMTPGLVVDGKVKCAGRVPGKKEIMNWLQVQRSLGFSGGLPSPTEA